MRHLLILVITIVCCSFITGADQNKPLQLLAIGNSFSNNVLKQLPKLAEAGGHPFEFEHLMIGGSSLQRHWDKVVLADKEPSNPEGAYKDKGTLRAKLTEKKWDVVTIQQLSFISHDPTTYRPYIDNMVGLIHELAPQAHIIIHQTWAYRVDDPRFSNQDRDSQQPSAPGKLPDGISSAMDMYELVAHTYRSMAKEFNLGLFPVGDALHAADFDKNWGYVPDPAWNAKTATAPNLPNQDHSLHTGWYWKDADGKKTIGYDGHHANMNGEFLGACVWYEVLFGESAINNPHLPYKMDPEYAKFLRATAHQAVVAAAERGFNKTAVSR